MIKKCVVCGKVDSENGWCPNCRRCWTCMEEKCVPFEEKKSSGDLCKCGHIEEEHSDWNLLLGHYGRCVICKGNCEKFQPAGGDEK